MCAPGICNGLLFLLYKPAKNYAFGVTAVRADIMLLNEKNVLHASLSGEKIRASCSVNRQYCKLASMLCSSAEIFIILYGDKGDSGVQKIKNRSRNAKKGQVGVSSNVQPVALTSLLSSVERI